MIDVNETLAALFQRRPEADTDGVFHYLLQEKDGTLVVDVTPYRQWTPELLKNTLVVDCERNTMDLVWINSGVYRATLGGSFPVETILYQEDEDNDCRELMFVFSHIVARVSLPPDALSFWIGPREYFDQALYDEQTYRVLASNNPAQ